KLSERQVTELVVKIAKAGLIEVIPTTDGKEFVTPERLVTELRGELMAAGGRLDLAETRSFLNVDLTHVERAAATIVDASALVGSWYLDSLADEVDAEVQDAGHVTLMALAGRFGLPLAFTTDGGTSGGAGEHCGVEDAFSRGKHSIRAILRRGALVTEAHVRRVRAEVRGALLAAARPVGLAQLAQQRGWDERSTEEAARALAKEGQLSGVIRGRDYVPEVFGRTQRACVDSFFETNGYVEYARAQKLQASLAREDSAGWGARPHAFVQQSHPDAVALDTVVVSAGLAAAVEATLEVAAAQRGWVAVAPLLPPALTDTDVAMLLRQCEACRGVGERRSGTAVAGAGGTAGGAAATGPAMLQLAEVYVVSMGFMDD
ncbi:unnamed protein product, partial [Phaeothamnion confervicola]